MAGKRGRVPVRLVEPGVLLRLSLGDVLLGLKDTGDDQPDDTSVDSAGAVKSPVLRLPDRRVEREPLLGGFRCKDQAGVLTAPRIVTRREDKAFACKPYRVEEGRALYAGVLRPTARGGLSRWYPGRSFGTATRGCAG